MYILSESRGRAEGMLAGSRIWLGSSRVRFVDLAPRSEPRVGARSVCIPARAASVATNRFGTRLLRRTDGAQAGCSPRTGRESRIRLGCCRLRAMPLEPSDVSASIDVREARLAQPCLRLLDHVCRADARDGVEATRVL